MNHIRTSVTHFLTAEFALLRVGFCATVITNLNLNKFGGLHRLLIVIPLALASTAFAQPVLSNIVVDDYNTNGGHSSFRVTWDSNTFADNQRVQWGPTNSYGFMIYSYVPQFSATKQQIIVSGLKAGVDMDGSRNIHLCPQTLTSGVWSACPTNDQVITIPAVPAVHPVAPTLPTDISIPMPNPSGCTVQTVASNLSDMQAKINTAVANQPTVCQIINIPPGASGTPGGGIDLPYPSFGPAADADRVATSTGVNTATNTFTPATAINAMPNGTRVRLGGAVFGALPGGTTEGLDYCITGSTGVPGSAFQLQLWPSCSGTVDTTSVGTFSVYVMPYPPPHSNYIWLRCNSTAYPPEGVRIAPEFKGTASANACTWRPVATGLSSASNGSLYFQSTAHHIYVGPGIDFAQANSGQTDTTDPRAFPTWITTQVSTDHIAIKQNWFTGVGYPERTFRAVAFEGSNFDFSDNYMDKIDYWMPAKSGLAPTISPSTVVTISSGAFNTGIGNCPSVSSFTGTLSGSTSGTAYITIRPSDCQPIITKPTATSLVCSGCTATNGTAFPVNAGGRRSHGLVASCAFSAGAFTSCANYDGSNFSFSVDATEGPSNITSFGPGPMRFANNYESSHGIFWHLDDTSFCCGLYNAAVTPSNVTFSRNYFVSPPLYRHGAAGNNGLFYSNRNQWEMKRGRYVKLDGNEFSGNYADVNNGPSILINGNAASAGSLNPVQSYAGDTTITNNLIRDASGGIQIGGGPPNGTNVTQLGRRFKVANNLLYNISGRTFFATLPSLRTSSWGYCFELSFGGEDLVFDHNTCYSIAGSFSLGLLFIGKMIEGFQFTNNALYFHNDAGYAGVTSDWGPNGASSTPNCNGVGTALINCIGNNAAIFSNNLMISGYTNSTAMTGDTAASVVTTPWTAGVLTLADSTPVARIAAAKWYRALANPAAWPTPNLRFKHDSSYISGGHNTTDGLDVGVDMDALEDALGWIRNVRALSVTDTGASINFHAPDAGSACRVGYGTGSDLTVWSRTAANTSASKERTIALSGLASGTFHNYQIWCAGVAPSITYTFTTTGGVSISQWSIGYCGFDCPAATDIDWAALSHLNLAWGKVKSDCTVNMTDEALSTIAPALISAAHAAGVKVSLSLYASDGGSGVNFAACTTAGNLSGFVTNIMTQVNAFGFDGVDLDWEPFVPATNGTKMTNLIAALRTALPSPKILTAAAIVDAHAFWGSIPSIQTNLDRVNVMTYDMWTGESYSYHHTALTIQGNAPDSWSIELAKNRFITGGMSAAKLGIGLAFYGYSSVGGTSPNVDGPRITHTVGTPVRNQIHYVDIVPQIGSPCTYTYDTPVETPYCSGHSGAASWLTYDNPQSIAAKVVWAKANNLGGWIIWNLKLDNTPANNPKSPLLQAIKDNR